jgi:hypothetical protein
MPLYEFESSSGEYTTIAFAMKGAPPIGSTVIYEGKEWKRIPSLPQTNQNTKIDPYSEKDFIKYTGSRKGTYGEMMDLSKELSEKRAGRSGEDFVKEKYMDEQQKKTNRVPFERKKKKAKEKLDKMGFTLE